ncbi:MAG: SUMF1/EgtB/PvdO family nonheme iron enzyme [Candidatus Poribacteria bacterium]|nr:SUMF1/EgtB/PvdO family nonheme iron enzyme [Candidatus Poribacteria bacterium]
MKTFCIITCLLMLALSQQVVYAQQPLAQQAFVIFEQHCLDCHGEFGSYGDVLTIKHKDLIENRSVIPRQPDASEFYLRLIGDTDNGSQMPLGQDPLDFEAITTVRRWIEAGAPDWEAIPKPKRSFMTTEAMLKIIHTHVKSLAAFDRSFARYFTLTHLYNAGASDDNLRAYRNALSKLVNSLSWGSEIIKPKPIDREETIFYIDLRHYEWDIESDKWYKIEQAYPYGVQLKSSTYTTLCQETDCELPFIRADWFIATASLPPLYHEILDLPKTDTELETRLEVNVAENLKNAPGVRVWRAGFNNSGVSVNNRVVERHKSRYGAYWKSYDFAGNVGTQNIFTHPLDFTHDGGEIIFNLPNGLQAYYLSTAKGERLDEAPINIVSNAGARDPVVRNGLSCMGCHTEGMKTFEDQIRSVIEQNLNPLYDKPQALRLYAEKSRMDNLVREDIARYRRAIEAAGGVFGGSEPIQQLVKQFEGPLDAAHAAAEAGLETDDFLQKIRENSTLQNAGLLVLGVENGSVKRDAWESEFGTMIYTLDVGKYVNPYANMALIPPGDFYTRTNPDDYDGEPLYAKVYIDAFYIDKYKVTNAEYKVFLDANPEWRKEAHNNIDDLGYSSGHYLSNWDDNTYPSGKDNYPVTSVSVWAAMAYAQWVGKRLPTEVEWEKAARGGLVKKKYPWGNLINSQKADPSEYPGIKPIGSQPANGYGLYEMTGSVHEWVLTEPPYSFFKSRGRQRVNFSHVGLRGGQRVDLRVSFGGDISYLNGFRCVKGVKQ